MNTAGTDGLDATLQTSPQKTLLSFLQCKDAMPAPVKPQEESEMCWLIYYNRKKLKALTISIIDDPKGIHISDYKNNDAT